jgi:predicted nucleic acid-binding protein
MGLILDSSVLIAGERSRRSVQGVLADIEKRYGLVETAISVVTVAELTHGIFRAQSEQQSEARKLFLEDVCAALVIYPMTVSLARLLGRIEGEQAALGISIAFPDLAIGATALSLGFSVVTHNTRHFKLIPLLDVLPF